MTTANLHIATTVLYFTWGILFVTAALLLLFSEKNRTIVMQKVSDSSYKNIFAGINVLIACLHLLYYQLALGGSDIVLLTIGWSAAIKGVTLFAVKEIPEFVGKIMRSSLYDWALFTVYLIGLYLLNSSLNIFPNLNLLT